MGGRKRARHDPRDGEWVKPDEILKWLAIILLFIILLAWLL